MFEITLDDVPQRIETGPAPDAADVRAAVAEAYERYAPLADGAVADYIPALAEADPDAFGICVCGVGGARAGSGASAQPFSIQSISKAFVFALVCEAIGHGDVHRVVGVNNTGLPFNSVMALELNGGDPMNPMVNAGAIATTGLMSGTSDDAKWAHIVDGLSAFAGRRLEVDEDVYASERANNARNQGLGELLRSYGRLEAQDRDGVDVVDLYTRQCALLVTAEDLAVMGATLAGGGVNPLTGERVVSPQTCQDTLTVLASCGMYERSGEWLFEIGLPAKSGVSGGIVAIAPGKGSVGVFSPPLDAAGNSVRGQRVCAYLSRTLGLNMFASAAVR